jgi:hypothetical protein
MTPPLFDGHIGPVLQITMETFESHPNNTVAVYGSHQNAEAAVKLLSTSGFNMKHLSIIGKDYETQERPIGFVNAGDRMLSWGKFGAFWGSIWGLLFGSAMLFIPGVGYLLFAGYIVSAIEGAALGGGLAALAGALASVGIPNDSVVRYEGDLKAGSFLLLLHGSEAEVDRAKLLLEETSPSRLDSFKSKSTMLVG